MCIKLTENEHVMHAKLHQIENLKYVSVLNGNALRRAEDAANELFNLATDAGKNSIALSSINILTSYIKLLRVKECLFDGEYFGFLIPKIKRDLCI